MAKELKITLKDTDFDMWSPEELVLRILMSRFGIEEEILPHVDENSTKEERSYICAQITKEYQNTIISQKEAEINKNEY